MIFKCHFERFRLKFLCVIFILSVYLLGSGSIWTFFMIFGILDPDLHENLSGSETLFS